ncbi:unnamed protein product, partial [Prorocentrum cordatum]
AYQARQPADKKDDDLADPICAEMLFWQSVKDNGFACPTSGKVHAIAGRWERAKKSNPQLKAEYNGISCPKAQEKFRKEWAKNNYDKYMSERIETQKKTKSSSTVRIAWLEGGGAEGLRAAIQNAMSCLTAGQENYEYHENTRKIRWAYSVNSQTDTMQREWEIRQTWRYEQHRKKQTEIVAAQMPSGGALAASGGAQAAAASEVTPNTRPRAIDGSESAEKAGQEITTGGSGKGKGKKRTHTDGQHDPGPRTPARPKAKAKVEKPRGLAAIKGTSETKAKVMKGQYSIVLMQAQEFYTKLTTQKKWSWAEEDKQQMKKEIEQLEQIVQSDPFHVGFLMSVDFNEFKKHYLSKYSKEDFQVRLEKFNMAIDSPLLRVLDMMSALAKQQAVREDQSRGSA